MLLVGLGNPSPNSTNNRHNVGFIVIDSINSKFKLSKQKPKFKGFLTTGQIQEKLTSQIMRFKISWVGKIYTPEPLRPFRPQTPVGPVLI